MKRLMAYAKGSQKRLSLSVIFSIISVISGLLPYYCIYKVLDLYIKDQADIQVMMHWCLYALLFYIIKIITFSASTWISHIAAYHILEGMRLRLTERFLKATLGEVQKYSIGEIKNIMVEKIENMEPPLAHMIPEGCGHLLLPVISIVALCLINFKLALASLITVPLSFVFMALTMVISGKSFKQYDISNANMNSTIVEYVEGIEVIKAFGRAGVSYEKYADAILSYKKFVVKWLSSTWITMKMTFALFPSTLLGVLPVGLYLTINGSISVSELSLAVMLSMSMVTSFAKLEVFIEGIREMNFNIDSIEELLTMKELPQSEEKVVIDHYDIKLNDVCFSYSGKKEEEVLHHINLDLKEGSYIALVGPSGSGKSTIAKLIARFFDVTEGAITIDGKDIRKIPLEQLSDTVSFVTQDNFLFRCSILENIRIGNPAATDEQVKEAAKAACCEEFINKLPQGYDTPAGEAGKRLSGGEKQRIAIARMMLKNAPVVILDEATAFTDPENEDKLQQSIQVLTKGKTLLVIAHRLSTIQNADQIIVLKDGAVLKKGTQQELLDTCPLYERMWKAHIGSKAWAVSTGGED